MGFFKLFAAVALTLGCTTDTASRADSAAAPAESAIATASTDSALPPSPPASAPGSTSAPPTTDPASWKVNTRGIGPISAGMTVAEANAASGNRLIVPAKLEECDFVRTGRGPDDLLFMVIEGKIARVDVARSSTVTTEAGAKIGDTEDRIKALYPGVAVQPHKYTDGHYLVVTPSATTDQAYRIVFETDGQKVLRYRSGRMPAVEYVEGCA